MIDWVRDDRFIGCQINSTPFILQALFSEKILVEPFAGRVFNSRVGASWPGSENLVTGNMTTTKTIQTRRRDDPSMRILSAPDSHRRGGGSEMFWSYQ